MTDANAAINPIILINEAVSQMNIAVQTSMGKITESFSQTADLAQTDFETLFGTATGHAAVFSEQLLSLAGIGATLGLTDTLGEINGQLLVLNESMAATQEGFGGFFDSVMTATGFISDLTSVFINLKVLTEGYTSSLNILTAAKKLFNAETWISIGNWIKETSLTVAHTTATWAQNAALTAYNGVKTVFNAIMNSSIVAWIKETAATVADTVAKGAQKAITALITVAQGALNLVMSMNPIALIVIAITALVAAFVVLWNKCEGFRNFMTDFFKFIANAFIGFVNLLIEGINLLMKIVLNPINLIIKGLNLIPGVNIPELKLAIPTIPLLATGGFPSMGQMFIAREAGPELVGTIGSRSAVVNNDQIVESVSAGVYRAVRDAMAGQNGGPLQLIMDGTKVAEVVSRNVNAITQRSGRCPILV